MDRNACVEGLLRDVWNHGDVEAASRYIAPIYTIHHDPGDPWRGQQLNVETYKERARILRAPFPDQHFDVHTLLAEGDTVIVTWLWSATHAGDLPGFPATGRRIHMSGATVYDFTAGRISGHWQITDRLGVYQQLQQAAQALAGA